MERFSDTSGHRDGQGQARADPAFPPCSYYSRLPSFSLFGPFWPLAWLVLLKLRLTPQRSGFDTELLLQDLHLFYVQRALFSDLQHPPEPLVTAAPAATP
jgi:hypothetical protein